MQLKLQKKYLKRSMKILFVNFITFTKYPVTSANSKTKKFVT